MVAPLFAYILPRADGRGWVKVDPQQRNTTGGDGSPRTTMSKAPPMQRPSREIPPPRHPNGDQPSGGGKLTGDHYYRVKVAHPIAPDVQPYTAECADIIEALGMTFNEGEAFKAIWRLAAGRQGKTKNAPQYDADKAAHYGERIAACVRNNSTPTTN